MAQRRRVGFFPKNFQALKKIDGLAQKAKT
jgi:hypothetical protein